MSRSRNCRTTCSSCRGGGGNTAVFVTADGVTVVDAKNPGWGQPILDKIKELSPKPVTLLINTHTHGDHVSGNVEFPASVDVVTQANTKTNMEKMKIFADNANRGMAKRTFTDRMTIGKGADQIDLYYFGPGHTNGDAFVVFPALRTMHAGDIFAGKGLPLIDGDNGGSVLHVASTLNKAHASIKGVETIINGHMPTQTTWADLKMFADMNQDFLTWAQAELKAGKTPEAAAPGWEMPEKYTAAGYSATRRLCSAAWPAGCSAFRKNSPRSSSSGARVLRSSGSERAATMRLRRRLRRARGRDPSAKQCVARVINRADELDGKRTHCGSACKGERAGPFQPGAAPRRTIATSTTAGTSPMAATRLRGTNVQPAESINVRSTVITAVSSHVPSTASGSPRAGQSARPRGPTGLARTAPTVQRWPAPVPMSDGNRYWLRARRGQAVHQTQGCRRQRSRPRARATPGRECRAQAGGARASRDWRDPR